MLTRLSILELNQKLKNHEISAKELVQEHFKVIENQDPQIGAYLNLHQDEASLETSQIDQKANFDQVLTGIPFANKPVISIQGRECNAASKMLAGFKPVANATVINKLQDKQAICLGNTNMDEFAQGSSTEYSAYQKTANPWDLTRVPGGSSGGSAAAVAAHEAVFALGTDTGGSIRQPAAFCGCVGFKLSYGRVSRSGVFAYASSLDTVGIFSRSTEDAALVLNSIAGRDEKDLTTSPQIVPNYLEQLKTPRKYKLALIKEFIDHPQLDPAIKEKTRQVLEQYQKEGHQIEEVSMPELEQAVSTYFILAKSEGSTNLHRYDGIRFGHHDEQAQDLNDLFTNSRSQGFGKEVKRCIMMGTYCLSAGSYDDYYLKAAKVRRVISNSFQKVFNTYDGIICPTSPFLPFKFGEKSSDPVAMYCADMYTTPASLA
ncbi:MAG TPA: Asp-tRNA(Asn)/Glu-tRNA(Gln) amidotransferase subunit GatA, partial [Candidatus Gracilibacteria bacterium]|nr:Asp-tRNA(Asn)/Glu-tRNA(Gln) amidotransferase subunit GatA [Candidatus Gracilibacteria bacterium]